jgi:DNA-binding NarL/FixJ family response regulator
MPIKVLLADDSELVRRAIRRLLADQPEIALIGEATGFEQTVALSQDLRPDIILLDLHMSDGERIGVPEFVSQMDNVGSRVLAISIWDDEETQAFAASLGAAKLLDKVDLATQLIPAIIELAAFVAPKSK